MARQIVTKKELQTMKAAATRASGAEAAEPKLTGDTYLERVVKYVPAEVVTVFVFVKGLIEQQQNLNELKVIYWIVFFIFLVLTPLYSWKVLHITKVSQLIISTGAFFVWVLAMGHPFTFLDWYNPIIGAVLLPIYTLVIAIIEPEN
jgi:hypothetical protein